MILMAKIDHGERRGPLLIGTEHQMVQPFAQTTICFVQNALKARPKLAAVVKSGNVEIATKIHSLKTFFRDGKMRIRMPQKKQ